LIPAPADAATGRLSKLWVVPYVVGILVLLYLILGTNLGAKIYNGVSIAMMVWFFFFSVYTLTHLLWLKMRSRRATKVLE
jgi:hypothetical protein